MENKKLSKETYKLLEKEGTHTVASKDTRGATRAMVFKDGTNKLLGPAEFVEVETSYPKQYEDYSLGGQMVIDAAERVLPIIAEYLTGKILSSFENWLQNQKKQIKRKIKAWQSLESRKAEFTELVHRALPLTKFNSVYEEYRINMTSEEAQKELIDIFMLEVIQAKKIWKVSHANIVDKQDSNGKYLEGNTLIKRLSNPDVLKNINKLLESKPELLEEWETMALSNILGTNIIVDGRFIPIDSVSLMNALTVNSLKD